MAKIIRTKKELEAEIIRIRKEAEKYPVGSEEYLTACKAIGELAEAGNNLKNVDCNVLIPGLFSSVMILFTTWYSKNNILDLKLVKAARDFWRKF